MSDLFNKCPVCGGWLYDICLTSNPPKYVKQCYQCGYSKDRDIANIIAAPSVDSPVIDGVGEDVPVTTNENGGKQSRTPYGFHLLPTSAIFDAAKVAAESSFVKEIVPEGILKEYLKLLTFFRVPLFSS